MVSYHRTEGFVFKKENIGEADRLFSLFTRDFGRVELFGKSIRKIDSKLKGGIEIFSLSEVEFVQGRHRKTLTQTLALERYRLVKEETHRFKVAAHVSDLLDCFIKGEEKDESLWDLLQEVWVKLDNSSLTTKHQTLLYYYFLWNLVAILGYKPELACCVTCAGTLEPSTLYFSLQEGGLLCQDCFSAKKNGIRVTADMVKVLRLMLLKSWDVLLRLNIDKPTKDILASVSKQYVLYLAEQAMVGRQEHKK